MKAKKLKRNVKKAGKWVGKYLKEHPEHKRLKTVIILRIMMKRYGFSLRGMISELYFGRGSRKAAGLKHVPSKSWLHKWWKRVPVDHLDELILFTAGKAAYILLDGLDPPPVQPVRLADLDGDRRERRRHHHVWKALRQDTRRERRLSGGQRLLPLNKL